jgi:ketosteroid isomerase-like protein
MKVLFSVLSLAVIAIALHQATSVPAPASEAAIREADGAWAKAVESKSVDLTVAAYDPEAVTAGSAMFPARGIASFRENWATLFSQPDFNLTWKADSVVVTESGTIAYSTGSWSQKSPTGTAVGPYLAVWRKQRDGRWKVLIDAAWIEGAGK